MEIRDSVRALLHDPVGVVSDKVLDLKAVWEVGLLEPMAPGKAVAVAKRIAEWGLSPAGVIGLVAIREGDRIAVRDEIGELSFEDVHRRTNALAHALAKLGVTDGDGVGIMCRNHRGFIDASLAAAKLGAGILYLNTAFAGRQLVEVVEREGPRMLIYDEEFEDLLEGLPESVTKVAAWREEGGKAEHYLEDLIQSGDPSDPDPPASDARFVILTSGTTGTPKGAQRTAPGGVGSAAALFDRIPYRRNDTMVIGAPMFHSWGFMHLIVGMGLGCTLVLRRRFDPEDTLRDLEANHAQVLAVVPVMMQRILELPEETLRSYGLRDLRVTAVSGSALPGELALRWMDLFGDCVYNLYGSTEVAYAAIAGPDDLRAAPGTAGRPPRNAIVKILDENGNELPPGETGRIFVGSDVAFEGYTGGGGKEEINGLLSSGDVGYFDEDGHLFVAGRDDDMIVSGGENVFPREVEDLLAEHDAVAEAAVIGVEDKEFGQRLKAFVVVRNGAQAPTDEDLKDYVKQNLARYKVPRDVVFLDALPRNATGKVLKRELRELGERQKQKQG